MKNLFTYQSYREFLSDLSLDENTKRGFQSRLAKAAGCQAAYLSQVLKQRVHLTEDQLLPIAEDLGFSAAETNYVLLLLRYEKAGTPNLQLYLKQGLATIRSDQNKLSAHANPDRIVRLEEELTKYFASWIPSVIHLLTSSENYRTVDRIAERLKLSKKVTKETLNFLLKMEWVKKINQDYHYASGSVHIPKESPHHSSMQTTRRVLALNSIAIDSQDSVHFSSIFTISKDAFVELNSLVSNFVQKSTKVIHASGTEDVYCLCLDLFQIP